MLGDEARVSLEAAVGPVVESLVEERQEAQEEEQLQNSERAQEEPRLAMTVREHTVVAGVLDPAVNANDSMRHTLGLFEDPQGLPYSNPAVDRHPFFKSVR